MSLSLSAGATARIPPANPFIASGVYDNSEYPTPDTVYTVPIGQTLYIEGMSFTGAGGGATAYVKIDATQVFLITLLDDQTAAFAGAPIIAIQAGESLKTVAAAAQSYYWNFWGYIL